MTLDTTRWTPHPQRDALLGEVHARPFRPIATPARVLRFAFLATAEESAAARVRIGELCAAAGAPGPGPDARHHRAQLHADGGAPVDMVFEQHGEFITYTLVLPGPARPFDPPAGQLARTLPDIGSPGRHVVSVDICLVRASGVDPAENFDRASLAVSRLRGGAALAATDFRADAAGFVRWLVLNESLDDNAAGAMCVRVLEIETYRTMALLGLPEATRLSPRTARIERELADISSEISKSEGLKADSSLLDRLTHLAADLEMDVAGSAYRFGATRAYDELVAQRLRAVGEETFELYPTLSSFLDRRSAPAMRTCRVIEERQAKLSEKLTRATNLLRTRVDVEIEAQNSKLLSAMNERASMQLRLQQTVEGLSVAAISYYVVSLLGYVYKAMKESGAPIDPNIAMGLSVPFVLLGMWWIVRRIRKSHEEH